MFRWSRSLPVLAVVGATSVAACGGSDYPSKPNEACKESAAKIKGLAKAKSVSDLHVYFIRSQAILTETTRKLKAVKPPSDKQAAYQSYLAGVDQELFVLRQATNTVATNPQRAVALLQQQTRRSQDVSAKAKAAGLSQCGNSG